MSTFDVSGFDPEAGGGLTFHDPDEDEVGVDTQTDDFRFSFTLPSQSEFGAGLNYNASSKLSSKPSSELTELNQDDHLLEQVIHTFTILHAFYACLLALVDFFRLWIA